MEKFKIRESDFKNMDLPNSGYMHDAMNKLCKDLNGKLDSYLVEGLKRKGFKFSTQFELEKFIKNRCRCEDNMHLKERIYYVDDTPFFLHRYEIEMEPLITEDRKITMSANYGSFAYL